MRSPSSTVAYCISNQSDYIEVPFSVSVENSRHNASPSSDAISLFMMEIRDDQRSVASVDPQGFE